MQRVGVGRETLGFLNRSLVLQVVIRGEEGPKQEKKEIANKNWKRQGRKGI